MPRAFNTFAFLTAIAFAGSGLAADATPPVVARYSLTVEFFSFRAFIVAAIRSDGSGTIFALGNVTESSPGKDDNHIGFGQIEEPLTAPDQARLTEVFREVNLCSIDSEGTGGGRDGSFVQLQSADEMGRCFLTSYSPKDPRVYVLSDVMLELGSNAASRTRPDVARVLQQARGGICTLQGGWSKGMPDYCRHVPIHLPLRFFPFALSPYTDLTGCPTAWAWAPDAACKSIQLKQVEGDIVTDVPTLPKPLPPYVLGVPPE